MPHPTGASRFEGPLFVVGMPRSGTKLLRALLNNHSRIGLTDIETEFLPHLIKTANNYQNLRDYSSFRSFYRSLIVLPYFLYKKRQGRLIPADVWHGMCTHYTPADLFETLTRYDVGISADSGGIWGDKSPSYLKHMPMIKECFPSAKFIHIVRDVRDYALSVNKAWGKSILRAAQRWSDTVDRGCSEGHALGADYTEVHYERLLAWPDVELKRLCKFLGIEFENDMLKLEREVENLGAASGKAYIVKQNANKFAKAMKGKTLRRVEAISRVTAERYGYTMVTDTKPGRLSKLSMSVFKLHDGANLIKRNIQEKGVAFGLRYQIGSFLTKQ